MGDMTYRRRTLWIVMRRLLGKKTFRELGQRYGVSTGRIQQIYEKFDGRGGMTLRGLERQATRGRDIRPALRLLLVRES